MDNSTGTIKASRINIDERTQAAAHSRHKLIPIPGPTPAISSHARTEEAERGSSAT